MLNLRPGEQTILTIHRHWIALANKMTLAVFFFIPTPVVALLLASYLSEQYIALAFFFLSIYILVVLLLTFILWAEYYLDLWIVTTERIIDVEQKGLFHREVSEFMLYDIQDVTAEVPGILATFLRYGKITVQTAGENAFSAKDIPNVESIKDVILSSAKHAKEKRAGQTP